MPNDLTATQSRNLVLLLSANVILSAMMPMLIILGGLVGLQLAPTPAMATLAPSIQVLAGLVSAAPMSMIMARHGRRAGFLLGAALAMIAGLSGAVAMFNASFMLLLVAHALFGSALVCFAYFRFAAGEIVAGSWQATAISLTLGSGLLAAFLGPEIFKLAKDGFAAVPFAGAYVAIVVTALIGAIPLLFLKIDKSIAENDESPVDRRAVLGTLRRAPVATAIVCMAATQGAMIFLMTPTPLAMIICGFGDFEAGDVIKWHVVAMFAPSFFMGRLINRFGATRIIACGMVLLLAASVTAITGTSLVHFYAALALSGLGWNFGYIGSTSLLGASVSARERGPVQGLNETLVALVATITSFGSGAMIAGLDWAAVPYATLPVLVGCLLWLLVTLRGRNKLPTPESV